MIKIDMEMPKSCHDCRFAWAGDSCTYCIAQCHSIPEGGYHLHTIKWAYEPGKQMVWREDSCPLQCNIPRILTVEELHALKPGDSTWNEWRLLREDGTLSTGLDLCVVTPDGDLHQDGTWSWLQKIEPRNTEEDQDRYWSAKPTQEQRDAEPWPEWPKEEWHG